jgi:hypothetical protein
MSASTQGARHKVLVIPRQLEGFFYERLSERYSERGDVKVIVERRAAERRRGRWDDDPGSVSERRGRERRGEEVVWSLAEMPFAAS